MNELASAPGVAPPEPSERSILQETMRTMLAYPEQSLVQAQACLTLYNFTSGNEHKALLNRLEATEAHLWQRFVPGRTQPPPSG